MKQILFIHKFQTLCRVITGIVLLTGLIAPATRVSAANLSWSAINTPNKQNGQFINNSNIDVFAIAPDGAAMFAYDSHIVPQQLYKSTNGGWSWSTTDIGNGLEGPGVVVVDIAISPNYAGDNTVVAATGKKVYRSIDGGKNFYDISLNLTFPAAEAITSIDYSPWHLGYQSIIIGTRDAVWGGHVYLLTSLSSAWSDLDMGNWSSPKVPCDVLAVAFSPNNQSDSGIMAVVTNSFGTMVTSKYGNNAWGSNISNGTIFTQQATSAAMAFPSDFDWTSNHNVYVGTSGTSDDDAFLVTTDAVGSYVYKLYANGTDETEVNSIAVKGTIYQANIIVGRKDTAQVFYGTAYYSSVYWYISNKSPTGSSNTIVAWSALSDNAYAGTSGTGSAFSQSTDYGVNWNQISMISVSNSSHLSILNFAAIDDKNIFLLMWDNVNGTGTTFEAGDYTMLFTTTDSGSNWAQVWTHRTVTTEGMSTLKLSPAYASDNTLFVAQNDSRIWVTSDGGASFSAFNAPAPITAFGVVNKNKYYTGHDNAIYLNNRWTATTLENSTAKSIVITPDGSTIFVGTNDGNVLMSTDDAKTFTLLGNSGSLGTSADVIVAVDYNYASSKTIFAISSNVGSGINRWVLGKSSNWEQIDTTAGFQSYGALVVSGQDILYATGNTADKGLRRIIEPNAAKTLLVPESVTIDLLAGAKLSQMTFLAGSNTIVAVASNVAAGDYGYSYRLLSFSDVLVVSPELLKPADKATISEALTLTWKQIESNFVFTYRYQIATDPDFNGRVIDGTTTGSTINVTDLRLGGQYWWRVYVEKVGNTPLRSKISAVRTFNVELSEAVIKSPAYGAINVPLRPTFSWVAIPGATSYEIELSDNLNYKDAWVQKELEHTVWTYTKDLKYSTSYFWRVRAVVSRNYTEYIPGRWSEAVFTTVAKPTAEQPPVIIDTLQPPPPPVINLTPITVDIPATPAPPPSALSPFRMRIIIVIYSVLFLGIIALIVASRGIRLF